MIVKFLTIHSLIASCAIHISAQDLKLLHVLSANKFYAPDYNYSSTEFVAPKELTYEYFVKNSEDVPNSVKLSLYNLGDALRKTYNDFLGPLYVDDVIEMRTTEFPVSIVAGELINAGLWPPVEPQIWNPDLLWQPIPFVYHQSEEDTELLGTECPVFKTELKNVLSSHNLTAEQKTMIDLINEEGRIKVDNPVDASLLYLAVENSFELNQTLPEWLKKIYPKEKFLNLVMSAYDLLSRTTTQKRLNGGSFLKSIITNSKKYMNKTMSKDRKINVYSGDDRNFAGVMRNLNISTHQLPHAGSALIFELRGNSTGHFVKILYYDGMGNSDSLLPHKLDDCDLICPVNKFIELVSDVLPKNDLSLCGSKSSSSAYKLTASSFMLITIFFTVKY